MQLRSAETLRALTKQAHLSYRNVADGADCSYGFIGHLAGGRKTSCTPELATRIAEVLEVPLDVLFTPSSSADSGRTARRVQTAA
jgi:transcriptional regulator with XRE-family HTH domain